MHAASDPALLGIVLIPDIPTYLDELAAWRSDRDGFFANHYATPLSDEAIVAFAGLRYFPPDPTLVFRVELSPAEAPISIESSTGATSEYPGAGTVRVPFDSGPVDLWVLRGEEDDLFVPFRDATSGVATYEGGRYLALQSDPDDSFWVDFNRATNPYCAYDPDFSCPLPPYQNRLGFPVAAGELNYP